MLTATSLRLGVELDDGQWRDRALRALWIVVVVASLATLVGTMSPVLAMAPLCAAVALYALAHTPLHAVTLVYVFVDQLSFIMPRAGADETQIWQSPLFPIYRFLSTNVSELTGVGALRFSGAEAIYMMLGGIVLIHAVRSGPRSVEDVWGARVVRQFAWLMLAAVVWLELWGIARGGADFRQSVWQFRTLLWLPLLVAIFVRAIRDARDIRRFAIALTLGAVGKIAIGMYFLATVAWPAGFTPESFTSHNDSVLFVVVAMYWLAAWVQERSARAGIIALTVDAVMMLGLAENNRRTAFVSFLACVVVLYALLGRRVRRQINVALLCLMPFFAVYLAAGTRSSSAIFRPAAMILSLKEQKDMSAQSRDVENFNLSVVLKGHTVLGTGWGHAYDEIIKVPDISRFFAQYLFIAHNSVLWLLGISGLIAFPMIWMLFVVTVFLAARSYRFAYSPDQRTAAVWIVSVIVAYIIQAWGDMGAMGETINVMAALAIASAAKLAHATGAWPAGIPLLSRGAS